MNLKKIVVLLIALCVFCLTRGRAFADQKMTITLVLGENGTIGGESYVLTIPDSLTITQDGWNAFDPGINVKANSESSNTFSGTLNVTAASSHDWQLVLSSDESDSVSYTLAAAEGGSQNLTWTFTADEVNADGGTTKTAGVILGDTAGHAAGTYVDTITFTAEFATLRVTIRDNGYQYNDIAFNYTEGWTWQDMITAYPDSFSVAEYNEVKITVSGTAFSFYNGNSDAVVASAVVSTDGGYWYGSDEYGD